MGSISGSMSLRWSAVLLVCLFCIALSPADNAAHAASSSDVNLIINGVVASADVGPLIIGDRTLVPIRLVSEGLGWRVDWFAATRQVLITGDSDDQHVLLSIDDPVAIVHGQTYTMDVPPLIIGDRTLVPIRLVAEAFGSEVGWDDATRTVTVASSPSVEPEPEEEEVGEHPGESSDLSEGELTSVALVDTSSVYGLRFSIGGPFYTEVLRETDDRLTLFFEGVSVPGDMLGTHDFPQDSPVNLVSFRPSTVDDELYVTVDFLYPVHYELGADEDGFSLDFARIQDIRVDSDGQLTVVSNMNIKPRIFALRDPARVVMDFHGAVRAPDLDGERVNTDRILGYRIGRHSRAQGDNFDGVRIVLDLKDDFVPYVTHGTAGGLYETTVGLARSSVAGRRVVIDPGHGGKDPGATGVSGTKEKAINMAVALYVEALLRDAGADVIMTRNGDYCVYIYDRPEMANALKADVFVSIHANADPRGQAEGTETYYHTNHPASRYLAEVIHAQVVNAIGRPDRGVRFANFAVLRETDMPSALLEVLYMSSAQDERLLLDPAVQQRTAEAIVMALEQFFALH